MQKTYLDYPEISKLQAKIVSRRASDENTQIILDRTIFMPNTAGFLADKGFISDLKIISVEEKRDNIIHTVEGKPQKSEVTLRLDMTNRLRNLSYNTAFIIFKILFNAYYKAADMNLRLTDDGGHITIKGLLDDLDKDLIEEQINFVIGKAIKIENAQGISSIPHLGDVINNDIAFDNAAKVRGFKITNIESFGEDLEIDFITGSDLIR